MQPDRLSHLRPAIADMPRDARARKPAGVPRRSHGFALHCRNWLGVPMTVEST